MTQSESKTSTLAERAFDERDRRREAWCEFEDHNPTDEGYFSILDRIGDSGSQILELCEHPYESVFQVPGMLGFIHQITMRKGAPKPATTAARCKKLATQIERATEWANGDNDVRQAIYLGVGNQFAEPGSKPYGEDISDALEKSLRAVDMVRFALLRAAEELGQLVGGRGQPPRYKPLTKIAAEFRAADRKKGIRLVLEAVNTLDDDSIRRTAERVMRDFERRTENRISV